MSYSTVLLVFSNLNQNSNLGTQCNAVLRNSLAHLYSQLSNFLMLVLQHIIEVTR